MELTRQWKIAGATAAVAGLSLGGILSAGADEPGPAEAQPRHRRLRARCDRDHRHKSSTESEE